MVIHQVKCKYKLNETVESKWWRFIKNLNVICTLFHEQYWLDKISGFVDNALQWYCKNQANFNCVALLCALRSATINICIVKLIEAITIWSMHYTVQTETFPVNNSEISFSRRQKCNCA